MESFENVIFKNTGSFGEMKYGEKFVNSNFILRSAGLYRHFPDDRLVYMNFGIICIINEEDHININ